MSSMQLDLDGTSSPPERVVRKGFCGCGCGARVAGRSRYVDGAHRQRAYRAHVKREMERAGLPPLPSLRAAGVTRSTAARNGDAQTAGNGALPARRKPSGLQLSFWKAQRALERFLEAHDAEAPRNLSLAILSGALSDRQREQLHERKRAKRAPTLTVAEQREALERELDL